MSSQYGQKYDEGHEPCKVSLDKIRTRVLSRFLVGGPTDHGICDSFCGVV